MTLRLMVCLLWNLFVGGCATLLGQPQITAISPTIVSTATGCTLVPITITGTGFAAGQTLTTPYSTITLSQGTSPTKINLEEVVPPSCNWDARFLSYVVSDSEGNGSRAQILVKTSVNPFGRMTDGTWAGMATGGYVTRFTSNGIPMPGFESMYVLLNGFGAVASDTQNTFLVSSARTRGQVVALQLNSNPAGTAGVLNGFANFTWLAEKAGVGVVLLDTTDSNGKGVMEVFDATLQSPMPVLVEVGTAPPCGATMLQDQFGTVYAAVADCSTTTVYIYVVTTTGASLQNSVVLDQMTPSAKLGSASGSSSLAIQMAGGGWQMDSFSRGRGAGMVTVMGDVINPDGTSVGVRIAIFNALSGSSQQSYVDMPATSSFTPVMSAASELPRTGRRPQVLRPAAPVGDGELVVASAAITAQTTSFALVDVVTLAVVNLTATSSVDAAGLRVVDGDIYVACGNLMDVITSSGRNPKER
jgi:hypothetical protein